MIATFKPRNFRRVVTPLVLWSCLSLTPAIQADVYSDALDAFDRSDFQTAYDLLYPLAQNGEARAQYQLGLLHFEGWRVPGEYRTAHAWIQKAAERGYAKAQTKLGSLYRIGLVVPQDTVRAYVWFSLAAIQGDGDSANFKEQLEKLMTAQEKERADQLMGETKRKIQMLHCARISDGC